MRLLEVHSFNFDRTYEKENPENMLKFQIFSEKIVFFYREEYLHFICE